MKAAIVLQAGKVPIYADFQEPAVAAGEVRIAVSAAALSHVVKSRALGSHYSSSGKFPFVVGLDGVGQRDDGRRVYFLLPQAPFGTMAERAAVPVSHCIALPDELDDATAAAIAIPGLSSWGALIERAKFVAGQTVLVNGATGISGRLAVQIAKHLGAKKVIATGRNLNILGTLTTLGADATIALEQNAETLEHALMEQFHEGIDIVLDYLWGSSAERVLIAAAKAADDGTPIRYVQIGSASSPNITLPSAVLRSSSIEMLGSGMGSIAFDRLLLAVSAVFQAAMPAGLRIATKQLPLSEVESAWPIDSSAQRTVFMIGHSPA